MAQTAFHHCTFQVITFCASLHVKQALTLKLVGLEPVLPLNHPLPRLTIRDVLLQMPDPVQLTLYSNGLLMFSGPFRPFSDPQTRDLVKDIMDGYFPSELQGRFPEGVPFKVSSVVTVTVIGNLYSATPR